MPDESHGDTLKLLRTHFEEIDVVRVSTEFISPKGIKTIKIDDPGPVFGDESQGMNFNRILMQLQIGSRMLQGEYLLVMRSDLQLTNMRFVRAQKRPIKTKSALSQRIVTTSIYFKTRHFSKGFRRSIPASYHLSDWIWFGQRSDVLRIFNQIPTEKSSSDKLFSCPNNTFNPYQDLYRFRFPTEMYFGLNLAGEVVKHCFLDYNSQDRKKWLKFCFDNLVILSASKFGFKKVTSGHRASVAFPFFEPTMLAATTNSRRLFFLMMIRKILYR